MARAAASTFRLTGMPSAALPLDLCAPAEALGSTLNYYEQSSTQFPQPAKPLFTSTKYLSQAYFQSADFLKKGRLPLISEAIRLLKREIGDEVVISGVIPGPYTMLLYLIEPGCLFSEMKREPHAVLDALFQLSSFLSQVGSCYRDAGADLITIHEMGGSPGFIGPAKFEQFTFPAVTRLIEKLPKLTGQLEYDVVRYLSHISRQRFGTHSELWATWWKDNKEDFQFDETEGEFTLAETPSADFVWDREVSEFFDTWDSV